MAFDLSRRTALTGFLKGSAITVGVPLLDVFLDGNGTAMAATGAAPPVRFGTWFWGLGVNPNRWFPSAAGADYELKPELAPIKDFQKKINILGNFNVLLDGAPNLPHISGGAAVRTGIALTADRGLPGESFDVTIGDRIGTRTRFRSLEVSAIGDARNSLSGRGGGNLNSSEATPAGLYTRVFGAGFQDPNSASFTPDPVTMARRSVLSAVTEQRHALDAAVGAADKQKLDQYYTAIRQLENQLDVELTKPEPLKACVVPHKVSADLPVNGEIETVMLNHQLMTDLLVMALACDQTRVFNMMFNNGASSLTRIGSTVTHHQLTHEEVLDNKLGYQPQATYFLTRIMEAWVSFVKALDSVKEGDRTLLDNTLVIAHSETEFAKFHTIDNIPIMTAGSGGGRVRTGLYVDGQGTPVSRVGLTMQQAMGVSVDRWGTKSMETNKALTEILV
ncbi:MAG: DUF1552 domain-containing protein [Sphingomonadales bacterium]|nr:DUF1552 domain-containing protein [Sphingomonadales bacterium]